MEPDHVRYPSAVKAVEVLISLRIPHFHVGHIHKMELAAVVRERKVYNCLYVSVKRPQSKCPTAGEINTGFQNAHPVPSLTSGCPLSRQGTGAQRWVAAE